MQPNGDSPVALDVTALPASADPVQGCDDAQLATRVAAGDQTAAEELVRRNQASVRRFLQSVCYDRQAVDDLAQETFLRALKHAGRFDPKYPMRGWLFTIARRLSINHGDKQRRRKTETGLEPNQLSDQTQHEPERQLETQEQQELTRTMIDKAMQHLSEPQRVMIAMHYQQGLALDEIAGLMDTPLGTVKSHLHRGRKRMKEILEPQSQRLMP